MITRLLNFTKDIIKGKPAALRSNKWPEVRKAHLLSQPTCAACGRYSNLQVHHIQPFHIHRELELEPTNLITLCESSNTKCHLEIGHLGNWHNFNPNVITDAASHLHK
ncbi:MAG: HNH endonuclease [Proteobacteria bacterium]|nr:HNH endonuclease [Pseudomonadota bacterium]